jgi:hypothetical protein
MKGEGERCLAIDIDVYLLKPVNFERLHATLERCLPIQAETISLVWSSRGNPLLLVSSGPRCITSLRLTFGYSRRASLCDGRALSGLTEPPRRYKRYQIVSTRHSNDTDAV